MGNRVQKSVDDDGESGDDPVITKYGYDGWNPAKGMPIGTENFDILTVKNGEGSLTSREIQGDGVDEHLARIEGSNAYWYLADHLNSIRTVLDVTGSVVATVAYDAYGNLTTPAAPGLYDWTGREFDVETQLQFNRARYYDAATGRWISQDPLGFDAGDSNLYRYATNQPTVNIDPSGLIDLVHATLLENVVSIFDGGLRAGRDGLRWFVTPEGVGGYGSGASANAKVHLNFEMNLQNIQEIPRSVLNQASDHANAQLRGQGLGPDRPAAFARARGDFIAEWIRQQSPEIVWKTPSPGRGATGWHYAFQEQGWANAAAKLIRISGDDAPAAVAALRQAAQTGNQGGLAPVAEQAASRWGSGVKVVGRWGGRILIVVGIAVSVYQVYTATDPYRQAATEISGWALALPFGIAGGAAGAYVAGPIGGFVLGAALGYVGHSIGSRISGDVYDMLEERYPIPPSPGVNRPIDVPNLINPIYKGDPNNPPLQGPPGVPKQNPNTASVEFTQAIAA